MIDEKWIFIGKLIQKLKEGVAYECPDEKRDFGVDCPE